MDHSELDHVMDIFQRVVEDGLGDLSVLLGSNTCGDGVWTKSAAGELGYRDNLQNTLVLCTFKDI